MSVLSAQMERRRLLPFTSTYESSGTFNATENGDPIIFSKIFTLETPTVAKTKVVVGAIELETGGSGIVSGYSFYAIGATTEKCYFADSVFGDNLIDFSGANIQIPLQIITQEAEDIEIYGAILANTAQTFDATVQISKQSSF